MSLGISHGLHVPRLNVADAGAGSGTPHLTSPTASATGATTASLGVTTDTGNGTLYWVVSTSSSAPTAAQVAAGQDSTGSAAAASGSQAVAATGAQSASATGLTASTTYYAYFMQQSASAVQSSVASAASFATSQAPMTLSTTDKANANVTNGNNTVAFTSSSPSSIRASRGISSGKAYWEVHLDTDTDGNLQPGVADSTASLTSWWYNTGALHAGVMNSIYWYYNNTANTTGLGSLAAGDVVMFALDAGTNTLWVGRNGTWKGTPGTSGGYALSGISSPIFPACQGDVTGPCTATFRFTSAAYTYTPPTGFSQP